MRTAPLKYLANINERSLPDSTDPVLQFRYVDIGSVGRGQLVSEPELTIFADAPSRARRLLRKGDTIVSTVRTYLRAVWPIHEPANDLVASTGFAVLSPHSVDPRFFAWWVQSDIFIEEVVARSVGVSYPAINANEIGEMPVRTAPLAEQRAIADYLDAETARIDALITKKQQLIHLLQERWLAFLSSQFLMTSDAETRRVAAYAEVVLGRQRSPEHAAGPFMKKYLRAANVKAGYLVLEDVMEMNFTPKETERFALRPGDVLVTEGSGSRSAVGASAVWNAEIEGEVCFQNTLVRMRPRSGVAASFLGWWAEFAHATGLFAEIAGGANIFHVSAERVRSVPMKKVALAEQNLITTRLYEFRANSRVIKAALERQLALLKERRQALITAAVTGEFTVPGAP